MAAPAVVIALALGLGVAAPGAAERRTGPDGHPDDHSYELRPADAAQLAEAMHLETSSGARMSGLQAQRALAAPTRTAAASSSTGPDFELPFVCGTRWTGTTRSGHSPSYYAVDWNAPSDLGKPVVASAAGTVTLVRALTYSYGRYVVVDHGGGYTTLYAHLNSLAATVGQRVDQGDVLGYLGTSGNSSGPHLHFEQRQNGRYFAPWFSRQTWRFGTTAASSNCGDRPVAGDWNGDGRTDVGVWKPRATGSQFRQLVGSVRTTLPWASAGVTPVADDFDGDRRAQVGSKALGSSTWSLRSANGTTATVAGVGGAHDAPLTGDWNGDGRAELGWYRWTDRSFNLRAPSGPVQRVVWGGAGQVPVVGDWDGDGTDDLGSYDPVAGTWSLRVPTGTGFTTQRFAHGLPGGLPVTGDWDGDGLDDVGAWRPESGVFRLRTIVDGRARATFVRAGTARG